MGALYSIHTLALKGPVPRGVLPLLLRKPQKASEEGTTAARATRPRTTPTLGAEKKRAILGSGLCVMCVVGGMRRLCGRACMPDANVEDGVEERQAEQQQTARSHQNPSATPTRRARLRATAIWATKEKGLCGCRWRWMCGGLCGERVSSQKEGGATGRTKAHFSAFLRLEGGEVSG